MEPTTYQPPMAPPRAQVSYAGFWKRVAALLIDKLILGFGAMIILIPIVIMFGLGIINSVWIHRKEIVER